MRTDLGRVLDPGALEASTGPRARMSVEVPAAWAAGRCEIDVDAPLKLVCARCDGGGCDGCGRSGAFRLAGDGGARTFRVRLPPELGSGAILRIAEPFGPGAAPEQLLLEVRPGETPSPACRLVGPQPRTFPRAALVGVALAVATIAALVAMLR